ncbi:hypothetical protein [Glycocaulis sp.]|uniref:hypothetical protein n=1 Tax=Glycocaulis sp. TaxID=1969725 RepID=UPI003D1B5915
MSKTLAFGLSALAGLIIWLSQAQIISGSFPTTELPFGINSRSAAAFIVACIAVGIVTAVLYYVETRLERNAYRKYRALRDDLNVVLSHWLEGFLSRQSRSRAFHEEKINDLLKSLARSLDKCLPGAVFQVSIMCPSEEHEGELEIGFGTKSDAGKMKSYVTNRRFALGEGYCGAAWYELAAQSGNGRRRLLLLKDPRYTVQRPDGYRDQDKSYFAVPIPAPKDMDQDILGVLSIDSSNANHFQRGSRNAIYLERLFTPVLEILGHHLRAITKK